MTFSADRKELADAISRAAQGLPSRPAMPTLAGMLLEDMGDIVTLTASDGSMTFTADIKAQVHAAGKVLLPGKMLSEVSKYFTGNQVTIEYQGGPTAEVIFGRSRITLSASDGEKYPQWSPPPVSCGNLQAGEFAQAVRRVIPAASGKANPVLESVLITPREHELVMVATDSYQMAVVRTGFIPVRQEHPERVLIPSSAIGRFARVIEEEGTVNLGWNDRLVAMDAPGIQVVSRQMTGEYLKWERVYDALPPPQGTYADTGELAHAAKMALLAAGDDGAVSLTLSEDGALVSALGQEGKSSSYVALSDFHGEDEITFLLGGQALLLGLSACGSTAEFAYTAPRAPLVLRSEGLTYMIQPRREL